MSSDTHKIESLIGSLRFDQCANIGIKLEGVMLSAHQKDAVDCN
jgi:hypothetical protein